VEAVEDFYARYYFRPRIIFRIVRRALFAGNERRRLYREAKEFFRHRAQRKSLIHSSKLGGWPMNPLEEFRGDRVQPLEKFSWLAGCGSDFSSLITDFLWIAETDTLDMGVKKGLAEDRARQSRELFLVAVVLPVQLWATARGRMKIDFGNSWRKVFQKTEDQVQVHVSGIIHAEDEMIGTHPGAADLAF
jgi:hypothetical protein